MVKMERHLSKLAVIQRENERWAEKRRLLLKRMGKEVDMVQECNLSRHPTVEFTLDEAFRIIYMPGEDDTRGEAGRMSAILEESQGVSAIFEESHGISEVSEGSEDSYAELESKVVEEEPLALMDEANEDGNLGIDGNVNSGI
ncbi:unnamed protein product [Nezara viridula]|uniref:Uncharacterized protein n=1 Tax=Nezara viridula TaxID=85310 RepID=A0A9P0MVY5_NEZVI|nr:unnamed protein product [Nezara viridula]